MRPQLCGSSWVLRPACFHASSEDWLIDRPQIVRIRLGSVFHQANSSAEFLRFSHCPCAFARGSYLLGFLPSSRHHHIPPNSQTFQGLLALSPALSTVRQLLQCDLRAYFIPQPSSGHLLVQGFVHFEQLSVFIRPNFAPMPLSSRTLTCKQAAAHERFDSDALLHTKSRTDRFGS